MKRLYLIVLIAITLCASCRVTDSTTTTPEVESELSVTLPSVTRLSLGNLSGNKYPIVWNEEDRISANGIVSEAIEISSTSTQRAIFTFGGEIKYPCNIIYPHDTKVEGENATIFFCEEQEHSDNISLANIPMCGYAKENKGSIPLTAPIGLLCLKMNAKAEGVRLKNITVTSESGKRLSGEFSLYIPTATIRPTANTSPSITYLLPEGYTLSTQQDNCFTIVVPATSLGDCNIVFTTESGATMKMKWRADTIKPNSYHEQKPITFEQGASGTLQPLIVEEDSFTHRYDTIKGYVRDSDGNPIANVAVSDGFSVVTTDKEGFYSIDITQDAWYIFISIPEEYEIPTNKYGLPCFFKEYPGFSDWFNFELKRMPGGKESRFALFGLADPQVSRLTHIERFIRQVAPDINAHAHTELGLPSYGITLGDVISMGSTDLSKEVLPAMRDAMHIDKVGIPLFQVMGNHDNCYMTEKNPVYGRDLREINLNIQRMFETTFGPINYSFNRGDAHIVGMRNIQWKSGDNCATDNTRTAFTEDQYEWLKQDLAVVPKNKVVVLCVHIPLYNNGTIGDGSYRQEVLTMLDEFAEAHVISGHLHYQRNYDHTLVSSSPHKIYEHAQAAVNGASWTSNINGDGVPNGYGVYIFDGNTIKDWYYKGYPYGMDTRDYQIRLYRGNTITGAEIPKDDPNKNGTKGYYQFGYGDDILLANVFNSDTAWKVEVYEDGAYSGKMTSLSPYHATVAYDELIGDYTYSNPKRPPVGVECGREFWAIGVLLGHIGQNTGGLYYKHSYQLWKYKLKNKNAKRIEVRATDRKGNVYKCSKITDGRDMTYALYDSNGEQ